MSTDYDALRAAAEAVDLADGEIGWYDANGGPSEEIRTKNPEDIQFIAAASPDVVLALLDELAATKEIARLAEESEAGWRRDAEEARAKLARIEELAVSLADPLAKRHEGSLSLSREGIWARSRWAASAEIRAALDGSNDDAGGQR